MSFAEAWEQDPELLPEKTLATIVASFKAHALSRLIATTVPVSAEEAVAHVAVPKLSSFKVGGLSSVDEVELGPFDETKTKECKLLIPSSVLQDRKAQWIEGLSSRVGEALAFNETQELATILIDGAGNTQALGGDNHYQALVKGIELVEADEQYPSLIAVNPSQTKDISLLSNLIEPQQPTGQEPRPFAYIRGLPCYGHSGIPTGTMILVDTHWAAYIGLRQDIELQNWRQPEIGSVTAIASMRVDYKLGLADAVGKVTGA